MTCKYSDMCWRCSYTKRLRDMPYKADTPPTRFDLVLSGHADARMLQKYKSLFATTFPLPDNYESQCPDIRGQRCTDCTEYKEQVNREARYNERKIRKEQYANKNGRARVKIPKEVRRKIAKLCGYKCSYCGRAIGQYVDGVRLKAQIDHIVPLVQGGSPTDESNLTLACNICNRKKWKDIWTKGQEMSAH